MMGVRLSKRNPFYIHGVFIKQGLIQMSNVESKLMIDWLSVTHRDNKDGTPKTNAQKEAMHRATSNLEKMTSKGITPRNGYTKAVEYPDGAQVSWHPERPQMGTRFVYTGACLRNYDSVELAVNHVQAGGRLRRIDMTIDTNAPLRFLLLKKAADAGKWVTRCRTPAKYYNTNSESLYVGAWTSDEFVRIYDKRGEQKLGKDKPIWNRIEMKIVDDKAENAGRVLASVGAMAIPRIIRGYVDFPTNTAWGLVFANIAGVKLSDGEKKLSDTKAWLLTSVAGTLAKICDLDPSFRNEFQQNLYALREIDDMERWLDET